MKTAKEIRDQVQAGELKAQDALEASLSQIHARDAEVGAFLSVLEDRARAQAEAVDQKRSQGERLGRLAGVPIAIKDNIHIRGELTTCASKFLTNYKALFNATVIEQLLAEDAILIGKTNLDEFAMGSSTEKSALKKTRNPWNLSRAPGGSSGGSAAAVSARMCPLSLGSDTGGSIRQPAAFCGIVGMKPTYGRISRFGLVAFGSSLDQIGPFATTVEDAAICMEILGQHCPHDSTSIQRPQENLSENLNLNLEGKTLGVPFSFLEGMTKEHRSLFDASIEAYKSLGVKVVDVDLSLLKYSIAIYYILATAEASTNLARFDGVRYGVRSEAAKNLADVYDLSKQEGFGTEVKRRILLGTFVLSAGYQDAYYKKAQQVRRLIIQQYNEAFKSCDIVAMPTTPTAAFDPGSHKDPLAMYLEDLYTISANLAGIPAISLPGGFTAEGMPVGLRLLGPQLAESRVLQWAHVFEKATAFNLAPEFAGGVL